METGWAERIKGPMQAVPWQERLRLLLNTHDRRFAASQRREEGEKAGEDDYQTASPTSLAAKGDGDTRISGRRFAAFTMRQQVREQP